MDAFIEEVVIPESWFFRDVRPFTRLQTHVRTHWLEATDPPALRVLSLPCAGGEEAYSIAIALRDIGFASARVQIDAVDLSSRALARARLGIYGQLAFRGPDFCDQSRYFRVHPRGFEVVPEVQNMVRFLQGNLLDAGLLADQAAYDVIFCRNLLIYLTAAARRLTIATLNRLLTADGLLFVGHAEAHSILVPLFVPDSERGSFAFRRASATVVPTPCPNGEPRAPAVVEHGLRHESPVRGMDISIRPAFSDGRANRPASESPVVAGNMIFTQPRTEAGPKQRSTPRALLDQAADLANRWRPRSGGLAV